MRRRRPCRGKQRVELRDELLEKHKTAAASTEVPVGMEVALCSGRRRAGLELGRARRARPQQYTTALSAAYFLALRHCCSWELGGWAGLEVNKLAGRCRGAAEQHELCLVELGQRRQGGPLVELGRCRRVEHVERVVRVGVLRLRPKLGLEQRAPL